jgi:hypothetical protein
MSEIEDWLQAHDQDLAQIASELGVDRSLVHVAAVFALAGMRDWEINQQLQDLLRWLDGDTDPLDRAQRTIDGVRRLVPVS